MIGLHQKEKARRPDSGTSQDSVDLSLKILKKKKKTNGWIPTQQSGGQQIGPPAPAPADRALGTHGLEDTAPPGQDGEPQAGQIEDLSCLSVVTLGYLLIYDFLHQTSIEFFL